MHVGSIDMAQLAQSDPQRAESLALLVVEFARTLVRDHGVKIVILNSMVPRDSTNMRCCAKIFELNMNLFNATLLRESEHDACMLVLQPHGRVLQAKGEQQRCPPPSVQLVWWWHPCQQTIHVQILATFSFCHYESDRHKVINWLHWWVNLGLMHSVKFCFLIIAFVHNYCLYYVYIC